MRLFTCNKPVKWKTRCVNAASCYSFWNSCWGYNLHLKIHESLLIVFLFHINKTVDYNHLLCSRIWGFPTSTSYQFVKCFRHLEYFAVYTFKNITNQDFCLNLSCCFYSKTFSQVDLIYFYYGWTYYTGHLKVFFYFYGNHHLGFLRADVTIIRKGDGVLS